MLSIQKWETEQIHSDLHPNKTIERKPRGNWLRRISRNHEPAS